MSFKEQMQNDADIFINMDEFAEVHDLNGTKCKAVLEGLTTKEQFSKMSVHFEGIDGETVVLHCKTIDLPEVPKKGVSFSLDGTLYTVSNSTEDMGIATITLEGDEI